MSLLSKGLYSSAKFMQMILATYNLANQRGSYLSLINSLSGVSLLFHHKVGLKWVKS